MPNEFIIARASELHEPTGLHSYYCRS